ncbi:putative zinc finger ccch-type protein [Diplodia seriata]|uniref:Putative zinc finger ccch-type protein n=1 Tax=Diplodia seriata TaxID=420778 RepID=A0A0G2DUS9_9PEZI|nr:putative zinc finger ccch-type protein [Diplodia seriata]
MLGDAQLDACESQVRSFRMMNGQYYETLQEILRKYESLVEDYRTLRSDYEEEKENREKYKRQARGQEKNPFVLLLVDGDGYTFKDHLIKSSRDGGVSAAQLLSNEMRDRLRKIGSLDHCRIVVRIYSNFASVSHALSRQGLAGPHARSIAPLAAAFTGSKSFFDYVDAGESSDCVAIKVEETFRLFAEAGQCKHIFFAGCHDARYVPLLSPHLGKADKITLIKAPAHQPEYHSLGLPVVSFSSVFRDSPMAGWNPGTTTIKGTVNKPTIVPPEPVNGTLQQRSDSKWVSDTPWQPKVKDTMSPPERPEPKKFNSAFTTAADLPRPTPETEGNIPINKYGDRLDFYLPRPTAEEYAAYHSTIKEPGRKPCNEYQLRGHCPSFASGRDCEYDHNPLSSELFHVLKVIVQGYPCPKQGECRKSDCYNGHVCQRPGCRGGPPCKFKNDYRAHNLDPKVAEWVSAIDIAEREADDAASVTMGDEVSEAVPRPASTAPREIKSEALKVEAEEWHPESAAWNPDAADWKPENATTTATSSFDLNKGTWQPGVASWNPNAPVWKSGDIDRSDIDSDSDSIAPQPEKEILDLGADDSAATSIFSPKARDGRFDSVIQTVAAPLPDHAKPLVDTSTAQTNGAASNGTESSAAKQKQQQQLPETNLMDDDWGNPPDGAGMTFAETAEPVNFDDDWGSAPPGVDNPTLEDEVVDFADDWGPSNNTAARKPMAPRQQNHGGHMNDNQSRPVW